MTVFSQNQLQSEICSDIGLPPITHTSAYRYIEHVKTILSSLELHLLYLALTEIDAPRPTELDEPINAFYDMHPREMVSALYMLGLKIKWYINAVSDDPVHKICVAKNGGDKP